MAALTGRREPLESEIQGAILQYLAHRKKMVFWRQNSGSFIAPVIRAIAGVLDKLGLGRKKLAVMSAVKKAAGFYKCTSESGIPDITCIYRGVYVGLEVKTNVGRLTKDQKVMHAKMEKNGVRVFIVRSVNDVIDALEEVDKMFMPAPLVKAA
jgi:hypothetical protein